MTRVVSCVRWAAAAFLAFSVVYSWYALYRIWFPAVYTPPAFQWEPYPYNPRTGNYEGGTHVIGGER